jgi:hypothetical protein
MELAFAFDFLLEYFGLVFVLDFDAFPNVLFRFLDCFVKFGGKCGGLLF